MIVTGNTTLYDSATTVTKSDTVNDPNGPFAALYVTAAGNLSFADGSGQGPVGGAAFAVTVGMLIPIRCQRVNATGTSATVVGLKANGPF